MINNKISKVFSNKTKPLFVAYITAGDPDYNRCLDVVDQLVDNGVDILELGVPFSDPLADGEVNQKSAQRALANGMDTSKCLDLVKEIRSKHPELPIVLYTYLNLVAYANDFELFCHEASTSGVDSLLILDLTPEEGISFKEIAEKYGISIVSIIAPTTSDDRLKKLCDFASGFIYYVSQEGVTGMRNSFANGVSEKITNIRKNTDLPAVVGFGISKSEHVMEACKAGVDGVVVGSAIVKRVEEYSHNLASLSEIGKLVKSLTSGISKSC